MAIAPPSLELTILMPCLNEAETLERCIMKANGYLRESGVRGEVVVADNGSTDGSQDIARRLGARVVDVPVRGYGAALDAGITNACGKYVIMGDSDDSYNFSKLDGFVEKLREGNDLVMGNRFCGGIAPNAMPFLHKYLGNPVLSFIGRLFFDIPVKDFHCGLRGFSRDAILGLNLHTTGMEFASEMVVKASLNKLRITEIPTTLDKDGRSRSPHLRTWHDGWRHLTFLLMYSPRWLFFYPGMLIFLTGTAGMTWLLPSAKTIGDVTFSVHTLILSGFAMILGFNVLQFALLSKYLSVVHGLQPISSLMQRVMRIFSLERLLIVGSIFIAFRTFCIWLSFRFWQVNHFGNLDFRQMIRMIVPPAVVLVIGVQIVFGAFLADIISLPVKNRNNRSYLR